MKFMTIGLFRQANVVLMCWVKEDFISFWVVRALAKWAESVPTRKFATK